MLEDTGFFLILSKRNKPDFLLVITALNHNSQITNQKYFPRLRHVFSNKNLKMKRTLIPFLILSLIIVTACNWHKDRLKIDVSGIKTPGIKIGRYDQDLFRVSPDNLASDLKKLQGRYDFFLGTNLDDPSKLEQMKVYLENPRTQDFHRATADKFKELSAVENDLTDAFRHLEYYYPGIKQPRFYSYISGGDYEHPVQLADSVVIIALDTYLGRDFKPYFSDGVPQYRAERMNPDYIVPDVMKIMAGSLAPENPNAMTLLDQIVEAGKTHYWLDAMMPDVPPHLKFGYTKAQADWITKNESHVWAAIIENSMLYSTDGKFSRMFLADGPNTTEFGAFSPPRMGEWIGWRIVRSYMENNSDVTLQQLLLEKYEVITSTHSLRAA